MIRLRSFLIKKTYLKDIKTSIDEQNEINGELSEFWNPVAEYLFQNVVGLYEQFAASFTMRTQTEGHPAFLISSIYVCGSLALNLWQSPQSCSHFADTVASILMRQIIDDFRQEGLQQAATSLSAAPSLESTWVTANCAVNSKAL